MTINKALLGTALLAIIVAPAMAAEKKMTKEIKELVGYNVTETQAYITARENTYKKMDKDGDNRVSFNDYQDFSNEDNEYMHFTTMDTNHDKYVSAAEFVAYNKTKGNTNVDSEMFGQYAVKGTNLKTRPLPETKTYFVPAEREVVEIKEIEPAAK